MKSCTQKACLTNDEIQAANVRGQELAQRVIACYGTTDVFEIAERAGVRVVYERWPLVTIGECEPRLSVIRINLAALERAEKVSDEKIAREMLRRIILAHELAHLFDARLCVQGRHKRLKYLISERTAHAFAASLLNLPRVALNMSGYGI